MNASPDSVPDPLAALPLLAEAGVSVYWEQLDGRTAWIADPDSREVWLSRAIPPSALLHYFVEALQVLDDGTAVGPTESGRPLRLVHAADEPEDPSSGRRPDLRLTGSAAAR